jgi:hypothetical protein|tara:strand:- start:218 stop:739 length:522 start_codon:yes stop_codon:yes gene_type:complete
MDNFDLHQLPAAYFSENKKSRELRSKMKMYNKNDYKDDGNIFKLKDTFLSQQNLDCINKTIIEILLKEYNIKIPLQNTKEIYIYCLNAYQEYGKNLPYSIKKQIHELNRIVIIRIIPELISNIESQIKYIDYLYNRQPLLERPKNSHGIKTLPSLSDKVHIKDFNKKDFYFNY